jgi:RNA polymerase sigma-70 factor (ECF subfamily)
LQIGSDKQLLRRIHEGRREACEELVSAHYKSVFAFLCHLGGNGGLAEDLTQETFAAAWRNIAGFRGNASLRTWLHKIAYNKFLDSCRTAERRDALPSKLHAEIQGNAAPGPLDRLMADEQSLRLREAIGTLDPSERAAIILHYMEERSYREMADVLDEPVGTVKWRTSRALGSLRAKLNGELSK